MFLDILKSLILGLVEGITEFLPISSTGHLILLNQWISFDDSFTKTFDIFIQLGAILAVIVFFWSKISPFVKDELKRGEIMKIWYRVIVGVIPVIIIGGLFGGIIQNKLFNPWVVAITLILGGIILLIVENKKINQNSINSISEISFKNAFLIGLIQCFSIIPGTSRSASTIIGSILLGSSREIAVDFSFYLAIPTMIAASSYSLLKHGFSITQYQFILLFIGFVVSFVMALFVIKFFIKYIKNNNFIPFAYYRIILGILVLIYFFSIK